MRKLLERCPALVVLDEGGEFDNKRLNKVFIEFGVEYSPTTPHTKQHNGVSKLFIRTLCELGKAILIEASLDKKFWDELLLAAVKILNLSPTFVQLYRDLNLDLDSITPHEAWFGW